MPKSTRGASCYCEIRYSGYVSQVTLCRCAYFVITPCCCSQELFNLNFRVRQEQQERVLVLGAQKAIEEEQAAAAESQDDAEAAATDEARTAADAAPDEEESAEETQVEVDTPEEDESEDEGSGKAEAEEEEEEEEEEAEAEESSPAKAPDGELIGEENAGGVPLEHQPVTKANVKKGLKCAFLNEKAVLERCKITKVPRRLLEKSDVTAYFTVAEKEFDVPWKSLVMVASAIQASSSAGKVPL